MKLASDLILVIALVVSAAWWIVSPSHEPLLALLASTGALLARAIESFRNRDISLLIGRVMSPIVRWHDRRTPRATLQFDSLSGTRAINHVVKAWSVWDSAAPTSWIELLHRQGSGSWTTVYKFEGHSAELAACDVDGDGQPEVVVTYSCGAHTRVVNIFRVGNSGFLMPIPGAEVGSDWPEIVLEDRDADGRLEICAKQRDWDRSPARDSVLEIYAYRDGRFQKQVK